MRQIFFSQSKRHRAVFSALLLTAFLLALAVGFPPAWAHAAEGTVVSRQPVHIPDGEVAEVVLVVGNDADVAGTVKDSLVAVRGDIHLQSTARAGIVIALGGRITQDPGARAEAVYSLAFTRPVLDSLAVGLILVVAVWAARLALSAALIAFPVGLALLLRTRLAPPIAYLEHSVRRAGLVGLLASVAFAALAGVSALTLVGLPVAALLLAVYGIAGIVGLTCTAAWLGQTVQPPGPREEPSPEEAAGGMAVRENPLWVQTLVGATLIMAFANIPVVGPMLLLVTWLVGVGTVTTWMWNIIESRRIP